MSVGRPSWKRVRWRGLVLLALAGHAGCQSVEHDAAARQQGETVAEIETFERVPDDYDSRVVDILRQPISADVIVSFYYMAASKSPLANYRWDLHRDGRLFLVRHSGKNATFANTFDRPLPDDPTKVLTQADIRALYSQFEQSGFFEQPGLQRPTLTEGGAYVVVRARLDDKLHEVVYENIENPLVNYLYSVAP